MHGVLFLRLPIRSTDNMTLTEEHRKTLDCIFSAPLFIDSCSQTGLLLHLRTYRPDSLLSRFDLLFIVLDNIDAKSDQQVADHVLSSHQCRLEGAPDLGLYVQLYLLTVLAIQARKARHPQATY